VTRYTTEVIGDSMTLLGSKPGGNSNYEKPVGQASDSMEESKAPMDNATDDLPF
jgi:single-stranded DNA-binding protein